MTRSPAWLEYRCQRNKVVKLLKTAHNDYFNNVIGGSLEETPKRFWSYIKRLPSANFGIPYVKCKPAITTFSLRAFSFRCLASTQICWNKLKEIVYIIKGFYSHRIGLEHQYGRRDFMLKRSIDLLLWRFPKFEGVSVSRMIFPRLEK